MRIRRFLKAEDGPTTVEYAVMLALIVMVCFAAVKKIGKPSKTIFNAVGKELKVKKG
ncbi:MAG TPA: Flp family type IVb pilin [Pirellulales bacterium]|jgi:pilus assembly protein Flp/PilA|nr:Flp family type IVb pilin [Pirellulales bacterium]